MALVLLMGAIHESTFGHLQVLLMKWVPLICGKVTALAPTYYFRHSHHAQPPSFVGNDYFCDTGSINQWDFVFYSDDLLWDGAGYAWSE